MHELCKNNGAPFFIGGIGRATAQQVIEGTWATQVNEYNPQPGKEYTFDFPPGHILYGRVWGTGIYTTDCSIASAAVHAGLITEANEGRVTIAIKAGQSTYQGSSQHGVTSLDWGMFGSSFVFVNRIKHNNTANYVPYSNWSTVAIAYNNNIGERYTFYFAPGGIINGSVWGTDIYTNDCCIAAAAVHAGIINTRDGGTVTIEILPGQSSYKGTKKNGVQSFDWGSYPASFRFVSEYKKHGRR